MVRGSLALLQRNPVSQSAKSTSIFKSWVCALFGFVYHEKDDLPAER